MFSGVPAILSLLTTYENYFPGLVDKMFIINSKTWVFCRLEVLLQSQIISDVFVIMFLVPTIAETLLLAPARNLVHPETNRIMLAFGTNRNVWLNEMLKSIDINELPTALGGSKMFKTVEDDYY